MTTPEKLYTTTVTQRGQVTIPAEIRRLLGAKPRDKVTFTVQGSQVCLRPASLTLESAYGSVKPSQRPEVFKQVSRVARDDKAERTVRKLRKWR